MRLACWVLFAFALLPCHFVTAQDCIPDPQLTAAAAELLLARNERPSAQALTRAVRAAGSDAVGLHALFVPAVAAHDSDSQWLASLRTRVDGAMHCGRADNAGGHMLIALGRGAALEPIDDGARVVRGQLQVGFREAELVIETADAQLIRVGVSAESLAQGVTLAPDLSLPLKVQLVARGPAGPRPVAEREMGARGTQDPRVVRAEDVVAGLTPAAKPGRAAALGGGDATASTSATEPGALRSRPGAKSGSAAENSGAELSQRLLALRAERGRGGMRANRLLREAASQHAAEVCAKGKVAHEVEAGVGPDARLARAGLDARVLGEAIARADGTESALDALKNSPSHLYTLLDPRFTDFGVGVAQDGAQKFCYVVLLCAWPRYVGERR
jgi:uncharacterized protein YkwD